MAPGISNSERIVPLFNINFLHVKLFLNFVDFLVCTSRAPHHILKLKYTPTHRNISDNLILVNLMADCHQIQIKRPLISWNIQVYSLEYHQQQNLLHLAGWVDRLIPVTALHLPSGHIRDTTMASQSWDRWNADMELDKQIQRQT
jgi:hypothetical protein